MHKTEQGAEIVSNLDDLTNNIEEVFKQGTVGAGINIEDIIEQANSLSLEDVKSLIKFINDYKGVHDSSIMASLKKGLEEVSEEKESEDESEEE